MSNKNDFTKEELQIILLDMNVYITRTRILEESPIHKALREKIESMIENYCEHSWIATFGQYGNLIVKCKLCNKLLA